MHCGVDGGDRNSWDEGSKLAIASRTRCESTRSAWFLLAGIAAVLAYALPAPLAGPGWHAAAAAAAEDAPGAVKANPTRIALWGGRAPTAPGVPGEGEAWLTVHPAPQPRGPAIVICPGGGYGGLVTGPEGHGIAAWLNRHGITGAVLEYRLPAGRPEVPLLDAQQALRTLRSRAAEWKIDSQRIGIMGFSAGGHLASTAATHFDAGDPTASDPVAKASCRPDFAILVYPVISMAIASTHQGSKRNLLGPNPTAELVQRFSNETQVTDRTPPTFLAHALDDKPVPPENSRMFHEALRKHNVASRYLELPSGGHGLNGYKGPMWDAWQTESLQWLEKLANAK